VRLARAALLVAIAATSIDSIAQTSGPKASASAAKVVIPPWPDGADAPAFEATPLPDDVSARPTPDEWKAAPLVRLSRVASTVTGCGARRVREWIKLRCDTKTAGMRLVAGSADGVALYVAEATISEADFKKGGSEVVQPYFESVGRFGEIVMPVRKGDRRAFEWVRLDVIESYDGPPSVGATTQLWIEEQWPDGGEPEIAVLSR
jgi:hypothetical protein